MGPGGISFETLVSAMGTRLDVGVTAGLKLHFLLVVRLLEGD